MFGSVASAADFRNLELEPSPYIVCLGPTIWEASGKWDISCTLILWFIVISEMRRRQEQKIPLDAYKKDSLVVDV
jgi:hypothetical protein